MSRTPALPPIHTNRRQRVVLDRDLAALYGVPTFRLNEAVKRNAARFPTDFRYQRTRKEVDNLISQFAISSSATVGEQRKTANSSQFAMSSLKHCGASYRPWAFTEHGALMAATVLNSPRAIRMSLFIIRAFVQMRDELAASALIMKRLAGFAR
jgi:ORF6N domain